MEGTFLARAGDVSFKIPNDMINLYDILISFWYHNDLLFYLSKQIRYYLLEICVNNYIIRCDRFIDRL